MNAIDPFYTDAESRPYDPNEALYQSAKRAAALAGLTFTEYLDSQKKLQNTLQAENRRQLAQKAAQKPRAAVQGGLGISIKPRPDAGLRGGQKRYWQVIGERFTLVSGKSEYSFRPLTGGRAGYRLPQGGSLVGQEPARRRGPQAVQAPPGAGLLRLVRSPAGCPGPPFRDSNRGIFTNPKGTDGRLARPARKQPLPLPERNTT